MNFLGALGAAGSGISAGIQDLERQEEQKFLKQQRARMLKQQADDDAIQEGLKGIRAPGKYTERVDDTPEYGTASTATTREVDYTPQQRARDIQALYQRYGRVKDADQYGQMADAIEDRTRRLSREDIQDRAARLGEISRNAAFMYNTGNLEGAMRLLQGGYDLFPDGRRVVVENGQWGVAGPSGKYEVAPQPLTKESVGQAVNMAMKFGNPALWAQFEQVRQGDDKVGIAREANVLKGKEIDNIGKYYSDKISLDRDELNAKTKAGFFNPRSHQPAERFNPIGLSDDGRRVLGINGGRLVEQPVPEGYSGMFPKTTGIRPQQTKPPKPIGMNEVQKFVETFGHQPASGYPPDRKTGKTPRIADLPFEDIVKIIEARSAVGGVSAGLPLPEGGLGKPPGR